jgi:hypothetical protein
MLFEYGEGCGALNVGIIPGQGKHYFGSSEKVLFTVKYTSKDFYSLNYGSS